MSEATTPKHVKSREIIMHKGMVDKCLALYPDELEDFMPGFEGTAEDARKAIREHPGTWFVGGRLLTPEEFAKWEKETA